MSHSFHNKILRVNLAEETIRVEEPGAAYLRRYLGGWNIIADVLLREVPAKADPLGPENRLIFAPGVLTGLAFSGVSRNAVGAKSPLTGAFGAAEVGGSWGAQLKSAGFDALVVEGSSMKPVYLWIKDGDAELRDASELWGKTTKETLETLRMQLGDERVSCAMIGPAGEKMVPYACIINDVRYAAGRTGIGAVMGSKKLKAVAVHGTMSINGVDPKTLRDMAREIARAVNAGERAIDLHRYGTGVGIEDRALIGIMPIHNFRDGEFPGAANLSAENFMESIGIGMEGCYACAVRCKKIVQVDSPYKVDPAYGGPEYETLGSLGACCGVNDIVAVCKASELCNAYSLDTIATGVAIGFAMECFENGLLTLEDTGGIDLRFGNGDALIQMVEKIAHREDLGALLGEGTERAAKEIGGGAERFAMQVKNQEYPMHEPRLKRGLAIGYAVSPTGADHCHALHDLDLINADENGLVRNQTLRAMGVLEPMALESLGPEKVRATVYNTISEVMLNCLLVCQMVPLTMQEKVQVVRAATGWDMTAYELLKVGERALTLARVFNAREGFAAADDHLADRSYGPTTSGALSEAGISRKALREAIHTYYGMMGWNTKTGVPLPEKLHELDVSWAVKYLPK